MFFALRLNAEQFLQNGHIRRSIRDSIEWKMGLCYNTN